MVFAADFDPIDSSSASQRRKSNQARISPVHQTNRLIAQAAQTQKVAKQAEQKRQAQVKKAQTQIEDATDIDLADIEVASRTAPPSAIDNLASISPSVAPLRKPKLPLPLKVLNQVQHGSTIVTSILVAGALALYGSSVYVDKSVNRTMSHLNRLQSDSQQLTSANEAIKQSLAEQAMQEDSGLEPYEAGDVLFVEPEPLRAEKEIVEAEQVERFKPIGY